MAEFLDVIDENDVVIGQEERTTVHARGLWHRGVHVLLFTQEGKMLIQKRSASRSAYASLWDGSVSEHVKAGEGYAEAAMRGMKEELDVEGISIEPLAKFRLVYGPNDHEVSMIFKGVVDPARVKFDTVEIAEVDVVDVDALRSSMERESGKFCGWFIEIMNWSAGAPSALSLLPPE